jgi:hypothetical protein
MTGLTPGSPASRLRELDHAGYVQTEKAGRNRAQTTVALTPDGQPRWIATPPCCSNCPRWPGGTIRHQHPTRALAMLTGTRQP